MIRITIETDNAAFHDGDGVHPDSIDSVVTELKHILRLRLTGMIDAELRTLPLIDSNGNTVGKFEVLP